MMLATVDFVGIATLVSAMGASVAGIIAALVNRGTKAKVEEVHHQVQTPNGATIGEIVAANDLTGVQHDDTTKH